MLGKSISFLQHNKYSQAPEDGRINVRNMLNNI